MIARVDFARRVEPEADDDIHTEQLAFDVRGEDGIWLITSIPGGLAEQLRNKAAEGIEAAPRSEAAQAPGPEADK